MRVVFFGTPAFAVPTLERLLHSAHPVAGVVTQPDRPRGRGQQITAGPVKALALASKLPVLQPDRLARETFEPALLALGADIGVVAAYGKILPDWLLAAVPRGLINVHASLLPRYRGASPVHRAVMAGDHETGVTIMRVVKELDAGPTIASASLPIADDETTTVVEAKLAILGAGLLVETLGRIENGTAVETPQDHARASYAPKITRSEGLVDWTRPARDIHNLIRGLWPWPHASTFLGGTRYILHRSRLSNAGPAAAAPGTIIKASTIDGVHVAAGDNAAVELIDLQLEGKRVMSAREALAARILVPGAQFSIP
jgi:methionyl-tRNA formyltransferase